MIDFWNTWDTRVLALLRIMVGFLIFWHGTQKLFGYPPAEHMQGELSYFFLMAGILEFLGGVLLIIGLFTRWTAFILSGMMAVAYCMVFIGKSFLPITNGGELAVLYCFIYFYIFFAGSGDWSLDNLLTKTKSYNEQ